MGTHHRLGQTILLPAERSAGAGTGWYSEPRPSKIACFLNLDLIYVIVAPPHASHAAVKVTTRVPRRNKCSMYASETIDLRFGAHREQRLSDRCWEQTAAGLFRSPRGRQPKTHIRTRRLSKTRFQNKVNGDSEGLKHRGGAVKCTGKEGSGKLFQEGFRQH